MPICGTITVDFDGFLRYLDCEITTKIREKTKRLQEIHTDLQVLLSARNTVPQLSSLFCCLPIIGRRRHTNRAIGDLGNIQSTSRMENHIIEIQTELQALTIRSEFIRTPEFREKVLGSCPICFDDLVDKSETTIIPDCLHPVCHSCFGMIYHRQQGYKCPICCATCQSVYEVWFCTLAT